MAKKNNLFCQKILSIKERNNLNNIQAIMIRDQEKQQMKGNLDVAKLVHQRKHSKVMEKKFSKMINQIMDNDDVKGGVDTQLVNKAEMEEAEDGEDGSMDSSRQP